MSENMAAWAMAALLLAGGVAIGQTHAPWPADWNNWNDPALWVKVGNAGNASDNRYAMPGYGSVSYTYQIGTFEVTAWQYTEFLNAVAATDTYSLYNPDMWSDGFGCKIQRQGSQGNYMYTVGSEYANRPVNFVSWGDAARFANWLTNGQRTGSQDAFTTEDGSYYLNGETDDAALIAVTRRTPDEGGRYYIPTEDEWYKAAYHKNDGVTGNYFDYPTGSDISPGRDMADLLGNNANHSTGAEGGDWPIDFGKPTTVVGEFQASPSPYGTFDQGGDLWEWTETIVNESNRLVRGGSLGYHRGINYVVASYRDGYGPPSYESAYNGFRLVEIPEPATLAMLVVGGLALLRRKRR